MGFRHTSEVEIDSLDIGSKLTKTTNKQQAFKSHVQGQKPFLLTVFLTISQAQMNMMAAIQ